MRDAVIFDMDGLLLDSERIAKAAFQQTCNELNIEFLLNVYNKCLGTNMNRCANLLIEELPGFEAETFIPMWNALYHEEAVMKPVPKKDGVSEFLDALQQMGIPCAVATSTRYPNAVRKLENAGIIHHFQALVGGDQVADSKPHPEIYLKAAAAINMKPADCLALEDSNNGVRAAYGAGMTVIQIPDMAPPSTDVLAFGHEVLDSMRLVHQRFM
jgi:HAD superfamily hydrolase (TIGR01509 family)